MFWFYIACCYIALVLLHIVHAVMQARIHTAQPLWATFLATRPALMHTYSLSRTHMSGTHVNTPVHTPTHTDTQIRKKIHSPTHTNQAHAPRTHTRLQALVLPPPSDQDTEQTHTPIGTERVTAKETQTTNRLRLAQMSEYTRTPNSTDSTFYCPRVDMYTRTHTRAHTCTHTQPTTITPKHRYRHLHPHLHTDTAADNMQDQCRHCCLSKVVM